MRIEAIESAAPAPHLSIISGGGAVAIPKGLAAEDRVDRLAVTIDWDSYLPGRADSAVWRIQQAIKRAADIVLREAQLQAEEWRHLLTLNPSAGITTELQHIYLARRLSHADRGDFELRGEEAEMEQFWAPVDELLEAVLAGQVREGPLAAAVLAFDALERRGRL